MIHHTLFSCSGKALNYQFSSMFCDNYTLKHYSAYYLVILMRSKVRLFYHHVLKRHECICSTSRWRNMTHPFLWRPSRSHPETPRIPSGKCFEVQFFHALLNENFKSIFGRLCPSKKVAFFNCMNDLPGELSYNQLHSKITQWITPSLSRLGVNLVGKIAIERSKLSTCLRKYLRPPSGLLCPPGNEVIFNRMNGSPGEPPSNCMNKFLNNRIVPFTTRLAGDPIGKEAERETTIGDTKHVNKYIN